MKVSHYQMQRPDSGPPEIKFKLRLDNSGIVGNPYLERLRKV
jgi:hypothetical protein